MSSRTIIRPQMQDATRSRCRQSTGGEGAVPARHAKARGCVVQAHRVEKSPAHERGREEQMSVPECIDCARWQAAFWGAWRRMRLSVSSGPASRWSQRGPAQRLPCRARFAGSKRIFRWPCGCSGLRECIVALRSLGVHASDRGMRSCESSARMRPAAPIAGHVQNPLLPSARRWHETCCPFINVRTAVRIRRSLHAHTRNSAKTPRRRNKIKMETEHGRGNSP